MHPPLRKPRALVFRQGKAPTIDAGQNQFTDRKALVDWATDQKKIKDDEPPLWLLNELTCQCFSLPLTNAKVLVDYGVDSVHGG